MKSNITTILPDGTHKRLVLVAISTYSKFTKEERNYYRFTAYKKIDRRMDGVCTYSFLCENLTTGGEILAVFEKYSPKTASLIERIRYRARVLWATAMSYIGVNPVTIKVR